MSHQQTPPTLIIEGKEVPAAPLVTVDFSRLEAKEPSEVSKLLKSCETHGFFYLDLQKTGNARQILAGGTEVFHLMSEYFAKPLEVKMKDHTGSVTSGYKPLGTFSGVFENSRDGYEALKFAHVEMMAKSPTLPGAFWDNAELIERFMGQCDTICQTVLSCLSDALQLEGAARFEESHRASDPTKTMLSLQHYRKGAGGHNKHTDISSLVVLFTRLPGLQVVMPETGAWTYVQPRPGHAIINVGDALRFLSGRRLYSCLHRVLPVNGDREKDSVVYSRRPTDSVKVEDTEGNVVTVKAWHDNKYSMFVKANEVQDTSKISTGGMTEVLQVA